MIDANDRDRLDSGEESSIEEFNCHVFPSEDLWGIPVLFFLNKQDLPNAISPENFLKRKKVKEMLARLEKNESDWNVQPCTAINGEGVKEGFKWLTEKLKKTIPFRKKFFEGRKELKEIWKTP